MNAVADSRRIATEAHVTSFKRLKTINSYVGLSRFLAECDWDESDSVVVVGYLARAQCVGVPFPYTYSLTVVLHTWNGKRVFVQETCRRRFEVYAVPDSVYVFATDEGATEHQNRFRTLAVAQS